MPSAAPLTGKHAMDAANASARAFDEFIALGLTRLRLNSWTSARRLITNTLGLRNPKIVSGGSAAS
jgi:hypothetical protein